MDTKTKYLLSCTLPPTSPLYEHRFGSDIFTFLLLKGTFQNKATNNGSELKDLVHKRSL